MNNADPRVKRTRKLILDAFQSLLMEKGFHAISVQDIADRATVNRATFYAHFVDKYELFASVTREWFRKALRQRLGDGAALSRARRPRSACSWLRCKPWAAPAAPGARPEPVRPRT